VDNHAIADTHKAGFSILGKSVLGSVSNPAPPFIESCQHFHLHSARTGPRVFSRCTMITQCGREYNQIRPDSDRNYWLLAPEAKFTIVTR
jgi:hypothetical protein